MRRCVLCLAVILSSWSSGVGSIDILKYYPPFPHSPMCTRAELGERLQLLHKRTTGEHPLFPGGPKVKAASVKELFASRHQGQVPSIQADEMAQGRKLVLQHVPFVIRNIPSIKALRRKWTEAYLRGEMASTTILVDTYKDRLFRYTDQVQQGQAESNIM